MIKKLLQDPTLLEWCKSVSKENGAKGCGVDFSSNFFALKVYVGLESVPTNLADFVDYNTLKEINKLLPYWDKTRESNLCVGYKIDSQGNRRKYFHMKLISKFNQYLYEKELLFLKLCGINLSLLPKGISYEMNVDNPSLSYKKYYFYVKQRSDIHKVLLFKQMASRLNIEDIQELEIYCTENKHKVNIVNNLNEQFLPSQMNTYECVPQEYYSYIKEIEQYLNTQLAYTGKTSDDVYSAYFSLTNKKNNLLNL